MSNFNEEDIADYIRKQNRGFYKVKLLKIPVFDQETGEEIREDEQYTVCNNTIGNENYVCYDARTAMELCECLNSLMEVYLLNSGLPAQLEVGELRRDEHINLLVTLAERINEKSIKLGEIQDAMNHELVCELDYIHKSNKIKIKPGLVKEELGLSKNPTEKQVVAYCEEKYEREFNNWKIAKANTSLLNKQLDLINDMISFEKYYVRMELKQG